MAEGLPGLVKDVVFCTTVAHWRETPDHCLRDLPPGMPGLVQANSSAIYPHQQ